jgi:hypothetical protein
MAASYVGGWRKSAISHNLWRRSVLFSGQQYCQHQLSESWQCRPSAGVIVCGGIMWRYLK